MLILFLKVTFGSILDELALVFGQITRHALNS